MYNTSLPANKTNSFWPQLLGLIVLMCIGAVIGQLVLNICCTYITAIVQDITSQATYRNFLLIAQAIMATTCFIVAPIIYWCVFEKKSICYLFSGEQRYGPLIILILVLIVAAMMVNTLSMYWNIQLKFPAFLEGFEKWSQKKEAELKTLTDLLTSFSSSKDLLVSILVVGIIPAFGEELVFRGILQNLFFRSFKNMHLGIWISACIFSAIHLQIYGFLPRFLLGALFGYLYGWTKNLAFPVVAHFFNNSITLIILFLQQRNMVPYELGGHQLLPAPVMVLFAIMGTLVAIYLYKTTRYLHN